MIMMTMMININNDDHNNDDDENNHNHTINDDNHNDAPEFVVNPPWRNRDSGQIRGGWVYNDFAKSQFSRKTKGGLQRFWLTM